MTFKNNNVIVRKHSLLDSSSKLEHLHTFRNMPVSNGCTTNSKSDDIVMDQIWDICKNTGLVQLRELAPLDLVYKFPHNDGVGNTWENHDMELCNFIDEMNLKKVFEIGAGSGRLGKLYLSKNTTNHWTALEPNYSYDEIVMPNFVHLREWFDSKYIIDKHYDAVIHSHVLEHSYDPISFLKTIHDQIDDDTLHIFSIPNLFHFIKNKFTNGLNFEHTVLLTEELVDIILNIIGFEILKKHYHREFPCIFYATKKSEPKEMTYSHSIYQKNKKVFLDYVDGQIDDVKKLNDKISKFDGEIFLFGGHIWAHYLIFNGLRVDKISCLLDNSKMKQGKRLYGTSLKVKSPKILKGRENVAVIVKAAQHSKEIMDDIYNNINNKVIFWD
tara:strand:- start:374 stop:1528 length:1155 start_codon:yes stop_codon:yes gene_type:complete